MTFPLRGTGPAFRNGEPHFESSDRKKRSDDKGDWSLSASQGSLNLIHCRHLIGLMCGDEIREG